MLLQSVLDMRKRLKGAPLSGMVSVVVTDIEGYTGKLGRLRGVDTIIGSLLDCET